MIPETARRLWQPSSGLSRCKQLPLAGPTLWTRRNWVLLDVLSAILARQHVSLRGLSILFLRGANLLRMGFSPTALLGGSTLWMLRPPAPLINSTADFAPTVLIEVLLYARVSVPATRNYSPPTFQNMPRYMFCFHP